MEPTTVANDWTACDGVANSSDLFLDLVDEVDRLIRAEAHNLLSGNSRSAARFILAQLAHKHGMGPARATAVAPYVEALRGAIEVLEKTGWPSMDFRAEVFALLSASPLRPSGEPEPGGLDVERLAAAIRGVTDAHLWGVYAAGRSAWVGRSLFAREVAAEYARLATTPERPAGEAGT